MVNGYTSAERAANAKKQLRDKKGRWVEMGGGVKFMLNGEWVAGTVTGIHPDTGNVTIKMTTGKHKGHSATQNAKKLEIIDKKATLPEKAGPKVAAPGKDTGSVWSKKNQAPETPATNEPYKSSEPEPETDQPAGPLKLDPKTWKKVGEQQGTNDGGTYEAPDGKKYYVKFSQSDDHARNEVLADKLYTRAGVKTPRLQLIELEGDKLGTASEIIDGAKPDLQSHLNDKDYLDKVRDGFATDAWLANWDVAGLGYDNIVTDKNGDPVRVDPGGALLFRAQGNKKGGAFGDKVGEWDTLRDGTSPQSTSLFGDMTDDQLSASAANVTGIQDHEIDDAVDSVDFDPKTATELKTRLKKRRDDIKARVDKLPTNDSTAVENTVEEPEEDPDPLNTLLGEIHGLDLIGDIQASEDAAGTSDSGAAIDAFDKLEASGPDMTPDEAIEAAHDLSKALNDLDAYLDSHIDDNSLVEPGLALDIQNGVTKADKAIDTFIAAQEAKKTSQPEADSEAAPAPVETPKGSAPAVPAGTIGTDSEGKKYVSDANGSPIYVGSTVKSKTDGLTGTVKTLEGNGNYVKVVGPDGKVKGRKISTLEVKDQAAPTPAPAQKPSPKAKAPVVKPSVPVTKVPASATSEADKLKSLDGLDEVSVADAQNMTEFPIGSKAIFVNAGSTSVYTRQEDGTWYADYINKDGEVNPNGKAMPVKNDKIMGELIDFGVSSGGYDVKVGVGKAEKKPEPSAPEKTDDKAQQSANPDTVSNADGSTTTDLTGNETVSTYPVGTKIAFTDKYGNKYSYTKQGDDVWAYQLMSKNDKVLATNTYNDTAVQATVLGSEDHINDGFYTEATVTTPGSGADSSSSSSIPEAESAKSAAIGTKYKFVDTGGVEFTFTKIGDDSWKLEAPSGTVDINDAGTQIWLNSDKKSDAWVKTEKIEGSPAADTTAAASKPPAVPLGTVGVDPDGKKYVSDAGGNPIYVGSKVTSLTDGLTGTVKTIEGNGTHVKVIGPDGKIKGRKITTLTVDGSVAPKPAGKKANPYVPTAPAPAPAGKPYDGNIDSTGYNPVKFAGKDAAEYNDKKLPTNSVEHKTSEADPSSPYFGKPQPTAPTKPDAFTAPYVSSEWVDSVKKRYLDNPNKAKPSLEKSNSWATVQAVVQSGNKSSLDKLLSNKYIDQDQYDQATKSIDEVTAAREAQTGKYNAEVDAYSIELSNWQAANGVNLHSPHAFKHMPTPSDKPFFGGTPDWTAAHPGTVSLQGALDGIKANPELAKSGLSVAMDASSIEGMDMHVRRVRVDGDPKTQLRFKLTSKQGDALAKALDSSGAPKTNKIGIRQNNVGPDGIVNIHTNAMRYDESGGTWTLEGDGYKIRFQRSAHSTGVSPNALHNTVEVELDPDATPEDVENALTKLQVNAAPATEGDIRVFIENKIMSVFGSDSDVRSNRAGSARTNTLDEVKSKYGITVDDIVFAPDQRGRNRLFLSNKARNAMLTKTGVTGFRHNLSTGDADAITNILDGPTSGLLATRERWESGIGTHGMSSSADIGTGGADSVFTKPVHTSQKTSDWGTYVMLHPKAMLRNLDIYANSGDSYGRRKAGIDVFKLVGNPSTHEVLFKNGVSVSDFWYISVGSTSLRDEIIKKLKARGIVQINGVPVEQFVLAPDGVVPTLPDGSWDVSINPGPAPAAPAI